MRARVEANWEYAYAKKKIYFQEEKECHNTEKLFFSRPIRMYKLDRGNSIKRKFNSF